MSHSAESIVGTYDAKAVDICFSGQLALPDVLFRHVPQMVTAATAHAYGGALRLEVGPEVCHGEIREFGLTLIIQKYVGTKMMSKDKQEKNLMKTFWRKTT